MRASSRQRRGASRPVPFPHPTPNEALLTLPGCLLRGTRSPQSWVAKTSHFSFSPCLLSGAWEGLSGWFWIGFCPVPLVRGWLEWSSRRLSGPPSVFSRPHRLTVWSLHTGWVGFPHGMAASGLQQVYSSWQGGSFAIFSDLVLRVMQCLFCHFLLSRSKSQTHSDSRGEELDSTS